MKKLALLTLISLFSFVAMAQTTHVQDVSVTVEWRPLTITEVAAASWGTVIPGTQDSMVSTSQGVYIGDAESQGSLSIPTWRITGQPNATFDYQVPNTFTLTHSTNPSSTMQVESLTPGTYTLGGDGTLEIQDTMNMAVAANQEQGTYTGTFSVTVAYQ